MKWDYSQYVLRRPRHASADSSGHRVLVTWAEADPSGPCEADLLDLSREGFCLRTDSTRTIGDALTVEVRAEEQGFSLTLQGHLRWQRPRPDETWLLGCQIDCPLDWATLGELFLNNILAMEPRPDGPDAVLGT